MDKLLEEIREITVERGGLSLTYRLYGSSLGERMSYSIECICGEKRALLSDVTSLLCRSEEIFELLVRGAATPESVFDIMENILP